MPAPIATQEVSSTATVHVPVMLSSVLELVQPKAGDVYADATFGGGGYTQALLETGASRVLAVDRDARAIERGQSLCQQYPDQLTLVESNNNNIGEVCHAHGFSSFNGIVADLGLSSDQLNDAERGFSYQNDGPLDMRMQDHGPTAAEVLNRRSEPELADIFYYYGEERSSRKLARAVVEHRKKEKFATSHQFLELIERVFPAMLGRTSKRHPAQRLFQALRIEVNGEMDDLKEFLPQALNLLAVGGRLVVVSFHSLEDRVVKNIFRDAAKDGLLGSKAEFKLITKKPLEPTEEEVEANIRARSAKTRAIERVA